MKLREDLTPSLFGKNPTHNVFAKIACAGMIALFCIASVACEAKKRTEQEHVPIQDELAKQGEFVAKVQLGQRTMDDLQNAMSEAKKLLPPAVYEALEQDQERWEKGEKAKDINTFLAQGMPSAQAYEAAYFERIRYVNRYLSLQYLKENPEQLQGYYRAADGSEIELYHYDKESNELRIVITDATTKLQLTAVAQASQFVADFTAQSDERATFRATREGKSLKLEFGPDWEHSIFAQKAPAIPTEYEIVIAKEEP
jgi:hypothetical protein